MNVLFVCNLKDTIVGVLMNVLRETTFSSEIQVDHTERNYERNFSPFILRLSECEWPQRGSGEVKS